jgi:DNA (cytosine-5)-methyltransferase 1
MYLVFIFRPGEMLPSFPSPTHGELGSGLLPFYTIYDAISDIPAGTNDHDVHNALRRGALNLRPPFSPHTLARTITCGGGEGNYHPSGLRSYTNRELACLQTFPLTYQFTGKGARKQIVNAVPPQLSKALYQSIIQSLRETDERELAEESDQRRP